MIGMMPFFRTRQSPAMAETFLNCNEKIIATDPWTQIHLHQPNVSFTHSTTLTWSKKAFMGTLPNWLHTWSNDWRLLQMSICKFCIVSPEDCLERLEASSHNVHKIHMWMGNCFAILRIFSLQQCNATIFQTCLPWRSVLAGCKEPCAKCQEDYKDVSCLRLLALLHILGKQV